MKKEVDISLLEVNLKLTEEQRIQNHQGVLDFIYHIKKATKQLNDKSQ